MKRILRILAIAAICGVLVTPTIEARGSRTTHGQTNNGNNGSRNNGSRSGGRANNPSRPSNNNTGNSGTRPGNNANNPGNRPGSNPGNNNNPGNRPGNGGVRPTPPGNNHFNRPGNNPGNRPHDNVRPGTSRPPVHSTPPPHRPNRPTAWAPPRPPRGWRPGRLYPTFSTILGITFGSGLNLSLSYLYNNGYNVYSYGNNVVYLNNVNQLNLLWPDASLYYGTSGLDRGEFIYSTTYYDTMRYNDAYARLVAAYGAPVSTTYPSNGMQTCWFGNDGRFVTLQYAPAYGSDGVMRYYTTLSFGI